jgi:Na+/proline symporter
MERKQYLAIGITLVGLIIAYNTEVQGVIGIIAGTIACISYTWVFLDITKKY